MVDHNPVFEAAHVACKVCERIAEAVGAAISRMF